MSVGCGSIEVDVWLGPGGKSVGAEMDDTLAAGMTLLTGHKIEDVSHHTLKHLYLDPILKTLDENNADRASNTSLLGLYKDDPDAEVQLVIDFVSLHTTPPFIPSTDTPSRRATGRPCGHMSFRHFNHYCIEAI